MGRIGISTISNTRSSVGIVITHKFTSLFKKTHNTFRQTYIIFREE